MKKITLIIFLIIGITKISFSQYEVRAGMGIDYTSAPLLRDYINQNFAPRNNQLGNFFSAIEFSEEFGYLISKHYQISIELGYLMNSFNYSYNISTYDFSYKVIKPSILNYYVIQGTGYKFKFGGGAGIRLAYVDQTLPTTTRIYHYHSTGFGFILRAEGNTLLSDNLYVSLGGDILYDINGEPKNGNNYIINNANNKRVSLNSFAAVIRLGLLYLF